MLPANHLKKYLGLGLATHLLLMTTPWAMAQTPNAYQTTTTTYSQSSQQQRPASGWSQASPATKIITGTAVGAAAGGATGLLTGMTMHATSHHAMKMARGTAVARGLGWGSVYGAGIGFLVGLTSAIISPKPVAVSTVGHTASR